MVDFGTPTKGGKWVCPNDRQLALRAKLQTGWSVKTQDLQEYGRKPQSLNETEQNIIKQVIQRAEILDQKEQERVGRLVDRLDNMKRNIMGNGTTQCILCGDSFGMFGTSNFMCNDCKKLVCDKCGVEIASSSQDSMWLCKICSETREMWKKSGAWFFKGLPKYKLPEKKPDKYSQMKSRPGLAKNNWSKLSVLSPGSSNGELNKADADEESSSEEEKKMMCKPKPVKKFEQPSKVQPNTSTLNVVQAERVPRSPGNMSTVSGSQFFNTSSDSGVGESERNPGNEKPFSQKYKREVSNESSESNNSTFSRQTSSTFSESQPNLTSSSTTYLSSVNQSYERLSLSCEHKQDPYGHAYDRYPASSSSSFSAKASIASEKQTFSKSQEGKVETSSYGSERHGRKLPMPGFRVAKSEQERKEYEVQKPRKKVSIDFSKAAAFLRHPLKGDKKKGGKVAEHSPSESSLGSSTDSGQDASRKCEREGDGSVEYCCESRRRRQEDTRSELGANHWMSQESEINAADSMTDLNPKWSMTGIAFAAPGEDEREKASPKHKPRPGASSNTESLSSLSRDYYWTEDQISIASSASLNPYSSSEGVRSQNARLGLLELSVRHDSSRMSVTCTVHRGEGLQGTDVHGLADPFCKLGLLSPTGKWKYLRTKTVHRTINPEFNEIVSFHGVTEADIQKTILHVMVLDDDNCGNCFLGEVRLPLSKIGSNARNMRLYLEKPYQVVQQEQEESEDSSWEEKRWGRRKY